MTPRILSIAAPLFIYATLALLILGLWREKRRLEWTALAVALAGWLASFALLQPVHRLFFDEDIYISIASNLTRAPVAQITLLGGPGGAQISSYYKEPPGWPVLLSFAFLLAGKSEAVAFFLSRILFALAVAAVYQLALEALGTRKQAVAAALLFGAAPACFWFSVSAGTDIPAALFATLGLWGLFAGNGALAAAGFALAAQTRMELIVLMPLVWFFGKIPLKWRLAAAGLVGAEIVHLNWVMSIAPILALAEKVRTGFSLEYVPRNLLVNVEYMVNPLVFPIGLTVLGFAGIALSLREKPGGASAPHALGFWVVALFGLYLLFYAGSFTLNPRYTIQIVAPLAVLAVSVVKRPLFLAVLLLPAALPYLRPPQLTSYAQTLQMDHSLAVEFASHLKPDDLVVSGEPEIFLNHGVSAMNAIFASEQKERLEAELRRRGKAWYHAGARTNVEDSQQGRADRWMKSNFELHLIESHEIGGLRIAFYELSLKLIDREAGLTPAFVRDGKGS